MMVIPEAVQTALVVGVPAFLGPLFVLWLTDRSKRKTQAAEWERQDRVAAQSKLDVAAALARTDEVARRAEASAHQLRIDTARAEARADEVASAARETARQLSIDTANAARKAEQTAELLVASNKEQAAERAVTASKLDKISSVGEVTHALVNSSKTENMDTTLEALEAQMVLLLEVAALKQEQGRPLNGSRVTETIAILEKRIEKLRAELAERAELQKKIDAAAAGQDKTLRKVEDAVVESKSEPK